jgi:hypothetical protein
MMTPVTLWSALRVAMAARLLVMHSEFARNLLVIHRHFLSRRLSTLASIQRFLNECQFCLALRKPRTLG